MRVCFPIREPSEVVQNCRGLASRAANGGGYPCADADGAGSGGWSQHDLGHSSAETALGVGLAVSMETEKQGIIQQSCPACSPAPEPAGSRAVEPPGLPRPWVHSCVLLSIERGLQEQPPGRSR